MSVFPSLVGLLSLSVPCTEYTMIVVIHVAEHTCKLCHSKIAITTCLDFFLIHHEVAGVCAYDIHAY